jgi:dihydroflavonol-4-reductase
MLTTAGTADPGRLEFAIADLNADDGWHEATADCRYLLHVASPFPAQAPEHEDELIAPARDGALRVLRAAHANNVDRVVMTSSFAAVGYGHPPTDAPFDETDWTDLDGPGVAPYIKSKAIAERAAWDYVNEHGGVGLTTVNPVGIFGPVLGPDYSSSIQIIRGMLAGDMKLIPRMATNVADVRDVADLHLRAAGGRPALPRAVRRTHVVRRDRPGDQDRTPIRCPQGRDHPGS